MNEWLDAYYRVSQKKQDTDGHSLDSQRKISKNLAKRLKLKLRPRDEGARSSTLKNVKGHNIRPELDRIKSDIEDGFVRNIWVVETSRLFRDRMESTIFEKMYLEKYGCQMFVGENPQPLTFDKSSGTNWSFVIDQILAEEESRRIRKRSIRGKRHLLENYSEEVPIYLGGTPTYGYTNKSKRWIIEKDESKWVKWMFREYSKGMQTIEIKNHLDAEGIKPRRTRTGLWNIGTIQKMLGNESYTGIKRYFDKDNGKKYVYQIPQIISQSLYEKVKKKLQENQKLKDNNKKHFSFLDGFLYCNCGLRMSSNSKKRPSGKPTETFYCVTKSRRWRGEEVNDCDNHKSLLKEPTEKQIINMVKEVVENSVLLKEEFKSKVLSEKEDKNEGVEEQKKLLEQRIKRNQKSLENTIQNIAKQEIEKIQGRLKPDIAEMVLKGLNEEREHYEREREKTIQEIKDLDERKEWLDWIGQFADDISMQISTPRMTEKWLGGLINKVIVKPEYNTNREGQLVQRGHTFNVVFKMKIVEDSLHYIDENKKKLGYELREGKQRVKSKVIDVSSKVGQPKKKAKVVGSQVLSNLNPSVTVE